MPTTLIDFGKSVVHLLPLAVLNRDTSIDSHAANRVGRVGSLAQEGHRPECNTRFHYQVYTFNDRNVHTVVEVLAPMPIRQPLTCLPWRIIEPTSGWFVWPIRALADCGRAARQPGAPRAVLSRVRTRRPLS